jgi:hypothetical protein
MATVIGLAVLVMGGIGVGTVVDLRLNHSEDKFTLAEEIEHDAETLEDLRGQRQDFEERWNEYHAPAMDHDRRIETLERGVMRLENQDKALAGSLADLQAGIATIEEDFQIYRAKHRQSVRSGLVGKSYDRVALRDGKIYQNVTVQGFESDRIDLRHDHGMARVAFRDLPEEWQARICWNPQDEEAPKRQPTTPKPKPAEEPAPETPAEVLVDEEPAGETGGEADLAEQIESARRSFQVTRLMLREARAALAEAREQAGGNRRSPNGNLETWEEKIDRLERIESSREEVHHKARAELARLSPNDSLFYQP